jgi:hypothetical protein
MIRAVVIAIAMATVVGTAQPADLAFTPPKRVIPADNKQQVTLKKQQAEVEKQQAELEKQRAELNKQQALKKRQVELEKQKALKKQKAELEKQKALKNQQADLETQNAELEKQKAIQKQHAELEKQKAELEKQKVELERQETELEKQQAELEKQEATFALPVPAAGNSITCDRARQIIWDLGFADVKAEHCTGNKFGFVAMRDGKSFSIEILAANGEVTKVERLEPSHK